jgi:hypothetical protein
MRFPPVALLAAALVARGAHAFPLLFGTNGSVVVTSAYGGDIALQPAVGGAWASATKRKPVQDHHGRAGRAACAPCGRVELCRSLRAAWPACGFSRVAVLAPSGSAH